MKVHPDRALADATSRDLASSTTAAGRRATVKTVCKKLISVRRKMYLHFAAPSGAAASRRRAKLDHAFHVVCPHNAMAADAGTLHAVTIRSHAAATGADSKGSASLMTETMTVPHALTEVLGDHLQSSR